jgi:hypothetical protein
MAAPNIRLLGNAAPDAAAEQTITITPDTRYVNVQSGRVVRFEVGAKSFTWNFDCPQSIQSFDLNRVTPPGLLDHTVTAYVSTNPLYVGG